MPRGRAPWTKRMFEILDDGEWHPGDAVILEMMKTITPGPATRKTEESRTARAVTQRVPPKERHREIDLDREVSIGKRRMAYQSMESARRNGRIEVVKERGVFRYVRLAESERKYVTTGYLSALLGRSATTVSSWLKDKTILADVRALLPPGIEPAEPISPGSRNMRVPREALPAWQKVSGSRAILKSKSQSGEEILAAVGAALDIEDRAERIRVTKRLKEELKKINRGIHVRQD